MRFFYLVALIFIGLLLYIPNLPSTVQIVDSGELVRAAFANHVPHPPGYPLFLILIKLAITLGPFGTVFWKAASLNVGLAILTATIIFRILKNQSLLGFSLSVLLMTIQIFWRYAVIPEVFILNAFFAAAILLLYLDKELTRYQVFIPFLFFLGFTNHLTLVFLAPVMLHVLLRNLKSKALWAFIFSGIIVFVGLYVLLLKFQPDHINSWGNLKSIKDIALHFLRSDYGTFQLVGTEDKGAYSQILYRLALIILENFAAVIVIGLLCLLLRYRQRQKFKIEEYIIGFSLLLYLTVFFALSNLVPVGIFTEVIDRFYILVFVLFFIWSAYQISQCRLGKKTQTLIAGILLTSAGLNYVRFHKINNFSRNTIIEDYAINLLKQAPLNTPTMLMATTDTRFFALEYVQTVLGIRPDVLIVHPRKLFSSWYREKIKKFGVNFNVDKIVKDNSIVVEDDFIVLNLSRFLILTHLDFKNASKYKSTILPLGILLEKQNGPAYLEPELALTFRSTQQIISSDTKEYDIFREIWSEYGNETYIKAQYYVQKGDNALALQELSKTLSMVPWHWPAKSAQCKLLGANTNCEKELELIQNKYYKYF